nr:MAG: hypothetical protein EDM05_30855 [Leptolyngbya sp. IPPAS B-1204]
MSVSAYLALGLQVRMVGVKLPKATFGERTAPMGAEKSAVSRREAGEQEALLDLWLSPNRVKLVAIAIKCTCTHFRK